MSLNQFSQFLQLKFCLRNEEWQADSKNGMTMNEEDVYDMSQGGMTSDRVLEPNWNYVRKFHIRSEKPFL